MENVMSYDDFKAEGVTGYGKAEDMLYRKRAKGAFVLLLEEHHSDEDIETAEEYLKTHHKVVSIEYVKLIE